MAPRAPQAMMRTTERRNTVKVRDLMTTEVVTVGPETPLRDVARILADNRISGLPVVDAQGDVLGVVSEADIVMKAKGTEEGKGGFLSWLFLEGVEAEDKLAARTAGEAMSAPAIVIEPDRPVHEAAATMTEMGVNRLPVVEDGKLVGLVTRADLVRAFTRSDAEILTEIREEVILRTFWIPPETVTVQVRDGLVTLVGRLETRFEAEALPRFVARVPGVVGVDSTLTWQFEDRKPERPNPRVPVSGRTW
jgi:CBS domain-containing protein